MKTAIICYSSHHGNTRKLAEAIAAADPEVTVIDPAADGGVDLNGFDRIGLASGIYAGSFGKPLLAYAEAKLPQGKPVFFLATSAMGRDAFFKSIRRVTEGKGCRELGAYQCQGYNTFGPFKLVGGTSKGHPTEAELQAAVAFYKGL